MTEQLPVTVRFMMKVQPDPSGCWVWTANKIYSGYGFFKVGERNVYAHRWSYERFVGPIPEGLQIDHLCRNRSCVNPDHLEPVTFQENMRRSASRRTSCKHGHPYTEENTYIDPTGKRCCRECQKATSLRYYYRKKNGQTVSRV